MQIVLLLANVLRSCPEGDTEEDDTDGCMDAANATPPQPIAALSPRASGGVPTTPSAATAMRRSADPPTAAATPRARPTAAAATGLPPLFAHMLELSATNASLRRRDRSGDDAEALASHTFHSFAFLGPQYCTHLLQMCSLPLLPGWMRAGCLAACCHSAPAAAPAGPSTPSSGPSSPNTDEPLTPSTTAVTAATTHVLHAWGPEDAEALQHFLATTAAGASTAAAMQLWTAALWHFAAEGRAIAYARLTHTLTPILPPAVLHEPCTTISLPLSHPSRSLILSKMPVARSTKIRWSAAGPAGFALAVQNTSEDRAADLADAPPVGAFIRNQSSSPQSLRFALGIMPEPTHVVGDAAAVAATAGRVVSTVAHLQRVFSGEGSLRAAVAELKGGPLPLFAKARHAAFPPAKALGFKSYSGDPALMAAWTRCASASALGRWVGLPVYVFMCFEVEDPAAAAPADAAAAPAE